MKRWVVWATMLVPMAVAAQATEYSPPPLVPAPAGPLQPPPAQPPLDAPPPPPSPAPEPSASPVSPGTPPPPAYAPRTPPSSYPYSPYGTPKTDEKPPVEWGLMVSETLFGALTAAGITVLPYFLLGLGNFAGGTNDSLFGDPTVGTVIFCLIFAATPLAVAQTQVSLANGSRHYFSDTWPAALAGLLTEAAILSIGYLTRGPGAADVVPRFNGTFVLVSTIAAVPLVQMAVINLFKTSRTARVPGGGFGALVYTPEGGFRAGLPMVGPMVGQTRYGVTYGAQLPLLSGRF